MGRFRAALAVRGRRGEGRRGAAAALHPAASGSDEAAARRIPYGLYVTCICICMQNLHICLLVQLYMRPLCHTLKKRIDDRCYHHSIIIL